MLSFLKYAVSRSADCYLLDDPLSAVDAHVGKHLFQKCIREHLNQSAVILVTHQLQYLREADLIVVLKQGRVQETGTFQYLVKNGLDFSAFLSLEEREEGEEGKEKDTENVEEEQFSSISSETLLLDQAKDKALAQMRKRTKTLSVCSEVSHKSEMRVEDSTDPVQTKEMRSVGNINSKVYSSYFRAGGNWFTVAFLLFINIVCQTLYSGSDVWLTYWTKKEEKIVIEEEDIPHPAVLLSNYTQSRYL